MQLIEVQASGSYRTEAFVKAEGENACSLVPIDVPTYPESTEGEAFRQYRRRLGLSLGEAALRLGLTVWQVSGLERGSLTVDSVHDWAVLRSAIGAPIKWVSPID